MLIDVADFSQLTANIVHNCSMFYCPCSHVCVHFMLVEFKTVKECTVLYRILTRFHKCCV